MLKSDIVLNSKGQPIEFSSQEERIIRLCQQQVNALGYEVDITTLTAISARVVEQKFFTIPFADYVPVRVGEGAWSQQILTYRDFSIGDDFSTGILNTGANNTRLAEVDAAVDAIQVPVKNWGKQIVWSIMDLQIASRSGNWDLVSSKERSRKKNWDLGLQKVSFLGLDGTSDIKGLLTQDDVTANSSLITEYISGMDATEFSAFVQAIIGTYRVNSQYTAMPTHFIIPEADYTGLAAPVSASFPTVTKMDYLLAAFRMITTNQNFKILPLAYANQAQNADIVGLNKNRYTLLNFDEDTIRMDIPVDYTNTLQNTINGFQFQNVGYGQFTGVKAYRPREVIYYDWAA